MNIMHFCLSTEWGGLEKYSVWLAEKLAAKGHNLHYFCTEQTRIATAARDAGLHVHTIKKHLKYIDLPLIFRLRRVMAANQISVLHAHMSRDMAFCGPAIWGTDVALFCSLHMIVPGAKRDIFHRLQYLKLKKMFALGSAGAESAKQNLPLEKTKVMELPYGLESKKYKCQWEVGRSEKIREQFGIKPDEKVIGVMSRIEPLKGQMEAVLAMPAVLSAIPKSRLMIVGEEPAHQKGQLLPKLHAEVKRLGIERQITFTGFRKDVEDMLLSFDMLLLPSQFESYSISVIEAKLCGVPVVGAGSGGVFQNLGFGKFGILVEPKNPSSIAEGIIATLTDMPAAKKRAELARENALVRYDENRILDIVESEYEK